MEFKQNQFTERALSQAARIEIAQDDFGVAALHYTQLLAQAQDKELKREATIALLNCYVELQNTEQMLAAAQAVMTLDKLDNDLQVKARSIIANHAFEQSEYHLAKKHYQWIVSVTNSEAGAKAKYQLAYILFYKMISPQRKSKYSNWQKTSQMIIILQRVLSCWEKCIYHKEIYFRQKRL